MRTTPKAVLLRLTVADFDFLKACAWERSLSVQDYLRDLLRYGRLPVRETYTENKPLTAKIDI